MQRLRVHFPSELPSRACNKSSDRGHAFLRFKHRGRVIIVGNNSHDRARKSFYRYANVANDGVVRQTAKRRGNEACILLDLPEATGPERIGSERSPDRRSVLRDLADPRDRLPGWIFVCGLCKSKTTSFISRVPSPRIDKLSGLRADNEACNRKSTRRS